MNEWMNAFVSRQVVWLAALSEGCLWEADRWLGVPHKSTARRASLWEGFISGHSWGFSHTISGGRSEGASVSTWLPSQLLASLEALPGKVFIDCGRWPRYFFFPGKLQGGAMCSPSALAVSGSSLMRCPNRDLLWHLRQQLCLWSFLHRSVFFLLLFWQFFKGMALCFVLFFLHCESSSHLKMTSFLHASGKLWVQGEQASACMYLLFWTGGPPWVCHSEWWLYSKSYFWGILIYRWPEVIRLNQ